MNEPLTDGIPTQARRDAWIHAFRQVGEYPEPTDRTGKWLIWLAARNIDRYWQTIKEAVEQGRLGDEAKEREEHERRARADFDALGKEMAQATTRAELVTLGRKRAYLAPHTGVSYVYENHCWRCKEHISSAIHAQCPSCRFYICSSCGACFCGYAGRVEDSSTH